MNQLRTLLQNMTPKGRLVLAASAVGIVFVAFLMLRMASAPSYTTVLTGMDPADTGEVTAALDEKGIAYELRNNGTALAVDKGQKAQARIALAEKGLPGQGKPGFELFDKQKLGASDFQQQVAYQRALEGEIARTIEQVDGVNGAQVQLVLPEDQLFQDQQSPAKAAVLLAGQGGSLEPGAVRGIAQLVASSVKGLKLSDVSVTDGTGALLWPNGSAGAEDGQMAATAKQAAEGRYAQQLESNLNAMLLRTLGPDKAQVQVQADLNTDQATRDQLRYARRGVPLRQRKEEERLRGAGAGGAGGPAGTAGNIPAYVQGANGGSNYNRQSEETDYGVDKEVTRTKIAPGAVNRLNVALVVDDSVPASEMQDLRRAVESAAGIDQERGDTVAVSQIPFAQPEQQQKGPAAASLLGYAKYAAAGIALLAFLIFVTRHLRRRENEALMKEPVWLREIEAPATVAELEAADPTHELPRARRRPEPNPNRRELDDLLDRDPERVAQQVRAWMNEG